MVGSVRHWATRLQWREPGCFVSWYRCAGIRPTTVVTDTRVLESDVRGVARDGGMTE